MIEKSQVISAKNNKKWKSPVKRQRIIFLSVMLAVPLLNWAIFWLYTNFSSIMLAFQDQRTSAWTLSNFTTFWQQLTSPLGEIGLATRNTFTYFSASLLIVLPLSLMIAYFIFKRIFGFKAFRIIFYLPAIISSVAMVKVFNLFIDPKGPLGVISKIFNITMAAEGLIANTATATATIVVYSIWTGFCANILLFNGAMTRVPLEVLESAKLEGCGSFREIVSIILPLIWPTMSTMIIFLFTGIFAASGPILLFDPSNQAGTITISYWIFKQVYGNGMIGGTGAYNLVSCAGLCFTMVGVPLILLTRFLIEKIPSVEY